MLLRIMLFIGLLATITVAPTLCAQVMTPGTVDCSKLNDTTDHANMDHAAHQKLMEACSRATPTMPGQAAFATISEIVRMLKADASTDWARVNIEALRQHLVDMDEVIMRAQVAQREIPGGLELTVTGTGRTADAIKRMAVNHARALAEGQEYQASAEEIASGARLTVLAMNRSDARAVARIRGLGFAGLMTEGDHHAAHHLALAKGDTHIHR